MPARPGVAEPERGGNHGDSQQHIGLREELGAHAKVARRPDAEDLNAAQWLDEIPEPVILVADQGDHGVQKLQVEQGRNREHQHDRAEYGGHAPCAGAAPSAFKRDHPTGNDRQQPYIDSIRTGALSNTIAVEVVLASRLHLMVYGPGRTERVISCPLDRAYVGDQSHGDDWVKRELINLGAQRDTVLIDDAAVREALERRGDPDNGPAAATPSTNLVTRVQTSLAAAATGAGVAVAVPSAAGLT
jgi:hypothetical protein